MPDDTESLIRRMIGGDAAAADEVGVRATTSRIASLLVAAALLSDAPAPLMARAGEHAATTRERQLVALAAAHLADDVDLLDALVRDHLADYPDNLLAAWIAAHHTTPVPTVDR